jgi:hypothetical protein
LAVGGRHCRLPPVRSPTQCAPCARLPVAPGVSTSESMWGAAWRWGEGGGGWHVESEHSRSSCGTQGGSLRGPHRAPSWPSAGWRGGGGGRGSAPSLPPAPGGPARERVNKNANAAPGIPTRPRSAAPDPQLLESRAPSPSAPPASQMRRAFSTAAAAASAAPRAVLVDGACVVWALCRCGPMRPCDGRASASFLTTQAAARVLNHPTRAALAVPTAPQARASHSCCRAPRTPTSSPRTWAAWR